MLRTALIAGVAAALVIPAVAQRARHAAAQHGRGRRLHPARRARAQRARRRLDDQGRGAVPGRLPVRVLRARPRLERQGHDRQARDPDRDRRRRRSPRASRQITWTADRRGRRDPARAPSWTSASRVRIPDKAGEKLTFKALQTYSGGEVVRWIGAEDSDNPAPIVTVTEAAGRRARRADHERGGHAGRGGAHVGDHRGRRRQRPRDHRPDRRRARPRRRRGRLRAR